MMLPVFLLNASLFKNFWTPDSGPYNGSKLNINFYLKIGMSMKSQWLIGNKITRFLWCSKALDNGIWNIPLSGIETSLRKHINYWYNITNRLR